MASSTQSESCLHECYSFSAESIPPKGTCLKCGKCVTKADCLGNLPSKSDHNEPKKDSKNVVTTALKEDGTLNFFFPKYLHNKMSNCYAQSNEVVIKQEDMQTSQIPTHSTFIKSESRPIIY